MGAFVSKDDIVSFFDDARDVVQKATNSVTAVKDSVDAVNYKRGDANANGPGQQAQVSYATAVRQGMTTGAPFGMTTNNLLMIGGAVVLLLVLLKVSRKS